MKTFEVIVCFALGFLVGHIGVFNFFDKQRAIESKEPIEPDLKLYQTSEGELDTTFVYKQPVR